MCVYRPSPNFAMHHTGLTVGGFIQPSIACNLIEILSNVGKGLCQRFLWLVPQPTAVSFENYRRLTKNSLPPLVHMYMHEVCNIILL